MCLAVPARVEQIIGDGNAIVDFGGVTRPVSLVLIDDVAVGDYVIVHVGFALQKLDVEEAERTLELFTEMNRAPDVEV